MKSAEKYPDCQGEPGNIQFLTRAEHLEAHDGNWKNPTNWYFNPVTKEKIDFGNGPFIPCEVIRLPEPVLAFKDNETSLQELAAEGIEQSEGLMDMQNSSVENSIPASRERGTFPLSKVQDLGRPSNRFVIGLKSVVRFIVEHPVESFEMARVIMGVAAKAKSSIRSASTNSMLKTSSQTSSGSSNDSRIMNIDDKVDTVEKISRVLPIENDVSAHKQRYHTKSGVIWKDKAPYHRGGDRN